MEERAGYFRKMCAFIIRPRKEWLRHKLEKAKRLMETPGPSLRERLERDKIVEWLGRKGRDDGNYLLIKWSMAGDVVLRPDPDILGRAIARSGGDYDHIHRIAHYSISKELDFNTRYYFARLLAAECSELGRNGYNFNPRQSPANFICYGAERMLRHLEETNPELVKNFEKERKG
jgi:hypothetical protein